MRTAQYPVFPAPGFSCIRFFLIFLPLPLITSPWSRYGCAHVHVLHIGPHQDLPHAIHAIPFCSPSPTRDTPRIDPHRYIARAIAVIIVMEVDPIPTHSTVRTSHYWSKASLPAFGDAQFGGISRRIVGGAQRRLWKVSKKCAALCAKHAPS